MKLWSDQSEQTSGLHMWNNSDISCRNTENILTMNAARRGYSLHAFLTRLILYFLFLWKCQGLAGNTDANFSLHTHLCVLCSTEPFSLHHEEYLFPVSVCRLQGPLLRSKHTSQERLESGSRSPGSKTPAGCLHSAMLPPTRPAADLFTSMQTCRRAQCVSSVRHQLII